MENVQKLRNELKLINQILALDLEDWPRNTKNSMIGKKKSSQARKEVVVDNLVTAILGASHTIIQDRVLGDSGINDVKAEAEKDPSVIVIDYLQPEKYIVGQFWVTDKKLALNPNTLSRLNILMSELGHKIGALSMPSVPGESKYFKTYTDKGDAVLGLESILDDVYGDELRQILFRDVVKDKIENNLDLDRVTVVIYNVPESKYNQMKMTGTANIINDK